MTASERNLGLFLTLALLLVMSVIVFYRALLVSLTFGALISYVLSPAVAVATRKLNVGRRVGTLLVTVVFFGFVCALVASLLPFIYDEALGLVKLVPSALGSLWDRVGPFKAVLVERGVVRQQALEDFLANLSFVEPFAEQMKFTFNKVWQSTPRVIGGVVNFL